MYNNKYFFSIYGENRWHLCQRLEKYIVSGFVNSETKNCNYYVHQIYNTGIPEKVISHDEVSLLLHGIVFPWDVTIDELDDKPEFYLNAMIDKYRDKLSHFALSIHNGSYCGVLHDERTNEFFAFTSFLNSFPVYYAEIDSCLVVSNDLTLVAVITNTELKMSLGLLEYYIQGTNLSDHTAFENIKSIPKGAYLRYLNGKINVDYYYIMPKEEKNMRFDDCVDEFAKIWESNVNALHSEKFKYGLGFTGGIDSRLILSAMNNKKKPLFFTGSHPDHPDYLIAKKITKSLGLSNHELEDYRECDKLKGYAEYCAMSDNPLNNNALCTKQQMLFRKEQKLVFELHGLTEFIGGVYHYMDRRSIKSTIMMTLPILRNKIGKRGVLFSAVLRNQTFECDMLFFKNFNLNYGNLKSQVIGTLTEQFGELNHNVLFLERARHIHKMANLLRWSHLAGRRYNEAMSPSMNIELTNFGCRTPLEYRDSNKILLSYLKRFHPETAKFVLSGYIFSANYPWVFYKGLSNFIKAFNALGYKIPLFQWYIKKHNYQNIDKLSEIYQFQKLVCEDSTFLMNSPFVKIYNKYPDDKIRLMRLFNIAVFAKRIELGEDRLREYLLEKAKNTQKMAGIFSKQG